MEKYENNWESLNKRPVPAWFEDAKFGIFIHWGLYSVPAYAPKKNYSEWYMYFLHQNDDNEYIKYHNKIFGKETQYEDFVKDFTAENFNADEWAQLFEKSGAKYINLVSKHHDGFCLYKSDYAWNWNTVDVGPHRDFCAELKEACDKTDVKFGVYHSVYEWYHPLYLKNPEEYAVKHLIPMLKELIEKYQPHTLFTDGEWEHESSVWHSTEFLQWLYNESSVKDYIVPNDRWGSETRGRVGGNFTTEYGIVCPGVEKCADDRVCEECRGIGGSFGWNKNENLEDYKTAKELLEMLVDLVSKGNNLLLNVGPTADGRIPVIMEERLLEIGKWLDVNGEAIYKSRKFIESTDENIRYTKRDNNVYAFSFKFPYGKKTLCDVEYNDAISAELIGCEKKIEVFNDNGKLGIDFGFINPEDISCESIYTVKLKGII